jgi:adenylosuccinate lyase
VAYRVNKSIYESPLSSRYASDQMQYIFSPDKKFSTWRRLWIALARAEMELGLPVTQEQINQMEAHITDIDYDMAAQKETELRHDVMAHIHTYGAQCPEAMPIIHLGATSCYVGDNTDIIIMRDGLELIRDKLVRVLNALAQFADKYKALPTLGFTHFQSAQLVTVGKRATLWMNELLQDLDEVEYRNSTLKLLGCKGTTGTQASFLELFEGDHSLCKELDRRIAREMGFEATVPVSGQTYSRKVDAAVLATLSGIAQSACKFATDVRLLCHLKEIEEPFEKKQIGSSAMPYKRNPMRCERICSLARYVIADAANPAYTTATQWFERTLDDSANKRISVPEAFLAVDAILNIYENVASGLVVHEKVIEKHIMEELPFMASENILMDAVKRGGDRQQLHERIRLHALEAGRNVKELGLTNNLLDLISADPQFGLSREELTAHMAPSRYIGRCPEQVSDFLSEFIQPVLAAHPDALSDQAVELKV